MPRELAYYKDFSKGKKPKLCGRLTEAMQSLMCTKNCLFLTVVRQTRNIMLTKESDKQFITFQDTVLYEISGDVNLLAESVGRCKYKYIQYINMSL